MMVRSMCALTRESLKICCFFLVLWGSFAYGKTSAEGFVEGLGEKVIRLLADKSIGRKGRKKAFSTILEQDFAMASIGKFVLGKHWRNLSTGKRQEYLKLFKKNLSHSYAIRFEGYNNEKFLVLKGKTIPPLQGKKNWKVFSQIVKPDGAKTELVWLVVQTPAGFRIMDVIVENVSMSVTQRSEYATIIEREGIDGLLKKLAF
ncbi:MAG: MlaC/ttg2D family ABC transporter substrate-binding protein [Alphaproteobacteria bacterium]